MVRAAGPQDARAVARMLHDFNTEFGDPSPGVDVLTERLERLLARDDVVALVSDEPRALAYMTFRPGIWDAGPVTLLDELYVEPERRGQGTGTALRERALAVAREHGSESFEINVDASDRDARRFYERHGFANHEEGREDALLYYWRRI